MNEQTQEYLRARRQMAAQNELNELHSMQARVAEQGRAIAEMTTGNSHNFQPEDMYETGDYLQGELHPRNWKALTNRRVAWPKDVDPNMALAELARFMEYRILAAQEAAQGRSLREMIKSGMYDS